MPETVRVDAIARFSLMHGLASEADDIARRVALRGFDLAALRDFAAFAGRVAAASAHFPAEDAAELIDIARNLGADFSMSLTGLAEGTDPMCLDDAADEARDRLLAIANGEPHQFKPRTIARGRITS